MSLSTQVLQEFYHQARQRRRVQQRLERKMLDRCRPYIENLAAVHGKLCRRMAKHIKELFVFVAKPSVPM